jgi:hypothetical protein
VFRRYDFVTMYSFRLFYYAYWHIAWGVIRLRVFFWRVLNGTLKGALLIRCSFA